MRHTAYSGIARTRLGGSSRSLASLLLAFCALAFLFTGPLAIAQDKKQASVLPAPSNGKAIVCLYRVGRFTGSSSHDEPVSYTHLRAHETGRNLVCRLLLEKKKK